MKIKIKNKVYDSVNEPVAVLLSDSDKANIANMHPEATVYVSFPKEYEKGIDIWIEEFKDHGQSEERTT